MAIEKTITLGSDAGLRLGGLTDQIDPENKVAVDTATVTGRIYDPKKLSALLVETDGDGATPALVILKSTEVFIVGEVFQLLLNDGTLHNTTIDSKDDELDQITMALAVPVGKKAPAGSEAKRQLGSDIAMATLYGGTPTANEDTWGYSGPVEDTHEGLFLGRVVHIEATADDGPGKRGVFSWTATVIRG